MILNRIQDWFLYPARWWQVWYWQAGLPFLVLTLGSYKLLTGVALFTKLS